MDKRVLKQMDEVRQAVRTDEVTGTSQMTGAATELLQRSLIWAEVDAEQASDLSVRFAEAQQALQRVTFQILRAVEQ